MKSKNKKSIIWIFVIIVIVTILCILIPLIKKAKISAEVQTKIQALSETPAAEYCKNSWWVLEIKTDESDVYWMCNFEDWSACEIVKYFRWKCLSASEQDGNETLYCWDWSACGNEEADDLSSRIKDINNIENLDKENLDKENPDEELSEDDLNKMDVDTLYEYYENEFNNSGDITSNKSRLKWWGIWDKPSCESVWWTILWDKCYLSNWVEIAF